MIRSRVFLGLPNLNFFCCRLLQSVRSNSFFQYSSSRMPFYAVAKGKKTGVFGTWAECQEQITAFNGAVFKKFAIEEEALQFVQERGSNIVDKRTESNKCSETVPKTKSENKSSKKCSVKDAVESDESNSSSKRKGDDDSEPKSSKKTKLIEGEDKSKFTVNEDGFLVVYTDGACEFNGRNGARAGIGIYFGPGHPMNVSEPVKGRPTNNTAEIQAATMALELTKAAGFDKVVINTDSQFMISCMTSWLPSWKKNDWKKKDGTSVINKDDLIDLDKASDGLLIKWNHVKGHDGIPGNEAADRLAREGAKKFVITK